jgi:LPS sulfotransferase NodH
VNREFWPLKQEWLEHRNAAKLVSGLKEILKDGPNLKHCFEIHETEFNDCLLNVLVHLDYRHVFLDRRNEVDRILSLALAEATDAWGKNEALERYRLYEGAVIELPEFNLKELLEHADKCARKRKWFRDSFAKMNVAVETVYFEDIYQDWEQGRAVVLSLLKTLQLQTPTEAQIDLYIDERLKDGGQDSRRLLGLVPNIESVRQALGARVAGAAAGHRGTST